MTVTELATNIMKKAKYGEALLQKNILKCELNRSETNYLLFL